MARLREDGSDCAMCFMLGCDCECATCRAAQHRNDQLSPLQLAGLAIGAAMEKKLTEGKPSPGFEKPVGILSELKKK